MYTLIAFKPEKEFWDYDFDSSRKTLPSKSIRNDNLTREECVHLMIELSTETPLVEYSKMLKIYEPDCVFEEFHVIPINITEEIEDCVGIIEEEAFRKVELINEEKQKEAELRRKNYEEERLANLKEERRKKFLELEKEFASVSKGSLK